MNSWLLVATLYHNLHELKYFDNKLFLSSENHYNLQNVVKFDFSWSEQAH